MIKENHFISENFLRLNEELELYKSIFLVKNLEINFKQKKENAFSQKSVSFKASVDEKPSNLKSEKERNLNQGSENALFSLKLKEKEEFMQRKLFLTLYEKFGVLFRVRKLPKFLFRY